MAKTRQEDEHNYQSLLLTLSERSTRPPTSWSYNLVLSTPTQPPGNPILFHLLSALPVLAAITSASVATAAPPTYFNTRHFILFGVLGSWLLSRALGIVLAKSTRERKASASKNPRATGHTSRPRTLAVILSTTKNSILGLVPPILLAQQTCGLFSTCRSWAPIRLDGTEGGVELNPQEQFDWNVAVLYPRLVGAYLAFQLGYALVVVWRFSSVKWGWELLGGQKRAGRGGVGEVTRVNLTEGVVGDGDLPCEGGTEGLSKVVVVGVHEGDLSV